MALDPDAPRAASHLHMLAHLTGPFGGGARDELVPANSRGRARVARRSRQPLLLAAPASPLEDRGLRLRAVLDPAGAAVPLGELEFAPWTEAGAFLPLHRPAVDPQTGTASSFVIELSLAEVDASGVETSLDPAEVAGRVQLRLLEGVLGRLLYALGAEKQRVRRVGREIVAMRRLATARDDALDRAGAELGLTRFEDQLVVRDGAIETVARREPDDELRRRLALYRPLLVPSRSRLLELLNGPGADTDPNRGLLAGLGFDGRFRLVEGDDPFAIAVSLVAAGPPDTDLDAPRLNFLDWLRATHLVWPQNTPQGNQVHAARYLPQATRERVANLRGALRSFLAFEDEAATNPAFAAFLAEALVRVGRCRAALGVSSPLTLRRAQAPDQGSRYELGMGVDIDPLPAGELDAMAAALADPNRPPAPEPETEALLASMRPRPSADDPEGRWLLEPCGLRTVHRLATDTLYLSHLPNSGLVITGPDATDPPGAGVLREPLFYEARFQAPGDSGANAALQAALAGAAAAWAARGGPPWAVLADADAPARWDQARPLEVDPPEPVARALTGGGLRALAAPAEAVTALKRLPGELLQTLQLDAGQAAALGADAQGAANQLLELVVILREQGLTSALPLVTAAGDVLVVVGVVGLPGAGLNLNERRATGFRWYLVPIVPSVAPSRFGYLSSATSRAVVTPLRPGLAAVVVLGHLRSATGTDPYQYRVELPSGSLLDLTQYEFLMNLLDHSFPAGVEVNTFTIRRQHVDLDGDGEADPLPPTASRTFRRFRHGRAGATAVD
jgi:hypothetical protein